MSRQIQLLVANSMVAANLRYLMRQQSIGQNALSKKTGVKQPTIHRILAGKNYVPRDATLNLLAKYFGITIEHLRYQNLSDQSALPTNLRGYRIPMVNSKIAGLQPIPEQWPDSITVYFPVSPQSFATTVSDKAMEPILNENDIVVVDVGIKPQPGQFAAARIEEVGDLCVRQYKALAHSDREEAKRPFELVPLNSFFPVIRSGPTVKVLGTAVAYWRKLI